jgi:hypothetical protein
MRYEDFVIQIGPDRGDGHPVQVLTSPAGEGSGVLKLPPGLDRWVNRLRASGADVRRKGGRHFAAASDDLEGEGSWTARDLGDKLFRALFSDQIRGLYDRSLGTVGSRPDRGLRIKLKLDAKDRELAHLASLPWEYLWRTDTQDFLSLSRLSPVVRYLDVPRPVSPIRVAATLRVLVVISSPQGLDRLNLQEEKRNLQEACQRWKGVEVTFLENADASTLRQMLLEKRFHVLHFMGHGGFDEGTGEGVLYFTRPDGSKEPLTGEAFSALLKDSKSLGLVLLNACETARLHTAGSNPFAGVANALVLGGLAAVIAMQFPISDQAAIAFSGTFYQQLAVGDPIDAAVVEGRRAVLSSSPRSLEWGTPVLLLRVPDAHVFQKRGRRSSEDEELYSAWSTRKLGVLLLLLALAGTAVPLTVRAWLQSAPAAQAQTASNPYSFDVSHPFTSTQEGLGGVLTRVELTPNGRMRLYFRFRNKSRQDLGIGFNYQATYLADKSGNRYAVLRADAPVKNGETAVDRVQPGQEIERWIEFPAPRDQARDFQVGLASYEGGAKFPLFPVQLPQYPKELSIVTPAVKPDPRFAVLSVAHPVSTNIDGFQGDLRGVELRDNTRMRWSFAFFNRSERDQTVSFNYSEIYLQDEMGNRYKILASDTGGAQGQVYRESLPRALRADHWFDFPAPLNGARKFTVVLISSDRKSLKFIPFTVQVPFYPQRYSRTEQISSPAAMPSPTLTPPPQQQETPAEKTVVVTNPSAPPPEQPAAAKKSLSLQRADLQWGTSVKGFSGRLQALEVLEDGRIRWRFEFVNQTGKALDFGLNLKETYISDNLGHRYSVARADVSTTGAVYQEVVPDGGSVAHWLEFPAPTTGARKFLAVLISHSPSALRFVPFQAELPERAAAH